MSLELRIQKIGLQYKKLHPGAKAPFVATAGAAGYDLHTPEDITLIPHMVTKIPTGIAVAIPTGYVGEIEERSSLGLKNISKRAGVIDSDYRGEIIVLLCNETPNPIQLEAGDRIAQLVIKKIYNHPVIEVDELPPTDRGEGGFGSTGV